MSIRDRLDTLTAKLWAAIDSALNTTGDDPPPSDSIAGIKADLDATTADITAAQDELTPITDAIAAITAIPGPQRTDAQKDRLEGLRIAANQQRRQIRVLRQQATMLRTLRTLTRQGIIQARFAMVLDGGPNRVRQSDVDGDE